jgi:hypothetical protein
LLLTCLMLPVLGACAPGLIEAKQPATSDYCRIAKPIGYDSAHDTPQTVAAIEGHNSAWVCVCEHDCPKPSH